MSTDKPARNRARDPVADGADEAAARLARAAATGIPCPPVRDLIGADDVLLASMRVGRDEPVACGRLLQPRIEAEVAFVLGRDITGTNPGMDEAGRINPDVAQRQGLEPQAGDVILGRPNLSST